MKKLLFVLSLAILLAGCGRYSAPAITYETIIDLPDQPEGAPLILMLHGYGESAEGFRLRTGFHEPANARGYAVVYVQGQPDPNDATSASGWNSGLGGAGSAKASGADDAVIEKDDVAGLTALVKSLVKEYNFDKKHVYVVGFSNGAFMTHRLAEEGGKTFSGLVSVAGKMPQTIWESADPTHPVSLFQITGEKDELVPKNSDNSARYAKDPAIEDVMDFYVAAGKLSLTAQEEIGKGSLLSKYTGSDPALQVWNLWIKDGHHSWYEEQITGINLNELILDYLDALR